MTPDCRDLGADISRKPTGPPMHKASFRSARTCALSVLLAAVLCAGPPARGQSADTAGDSTSTARDLGALASEVVNVAEGLDTEDVADFYKFTLTDPAIVVIDISLATRLKVLVRDERRSVLVSAYLNAGMPGSANPIETFLTAGSYYLAISAAGAEATAYTFKLSVRSPSTP